MVAKFEYFFSVYSKEATSKLEQDYIQMYLGELSPIQESQLVQLKSWVSDLLKGKVPSDPVMLRFLRARDFSVEKGESYKSCKIPLPTIDSNFVKKTLS